MRPHFPHIPHLPLRLATAVAVGALLAVAPVAVAPVATATNLSDITIVPVAGGDSLPAGTVNGDWTTLRGPVVEFAPYSNPDVLPEGTVVAFSLPEGFEWDAAAVALPVVAPSTGMPAGICDLRPGSLQYAGSELSFTLSGTHDIGCRLTFESLRVRASVGLLPPGGDITATWTVPGLGSASAVAGTLGVAAIPDDSTPIVPATRTDGSFDLGVAALIVVLVVAIGAAAAAMRRRPESPA